LESQFVSHARKRIGITPEIGWWDRLPACLLGMTGKMPVATKSFSSAITFENRYKEGVWAGAFLSGASYHGATDELRTSVHGYISSDQVRALTW
jgi:hypothetical protein